MLDGPASSNNPSRLFLFIKMELIYSIVLYPVVLTIISPGCLS